jgi:exosortase
MSESPRLWNEKWRLAALRPDDFVRLALAALLIGGLFALFHLQGNTTDITVFGRSAFLWMVARWSDSGAALGAADYSHGWLIPVASAGLVWWKRRELMAAPKRVCLAGLWLIIAALMLHWLGAKAQQTRLSLFAFAMLLWSIPLYFYGWAVARILLFPCAYLLFCIPLNFLDSLTVPLRLHMTTLAHYILNGLGFEYIRNGMALHSVAGGFSLEVADPCSGIRSLMAMTAITALYAYLTQPTLLKKWILFLAAVPLAVAGNLVRILTIALVSEAFGERIGSGLYHEASGYLIFLAITIPLMLLFARLLEVNHTEAWQRWKAALLSPS